MKTPNKIFIAYYWNGENEQNAEIYIGKTGSIWEFIDYWKIAYNETMEEKDIEGVYSIKEEMGIDGKMYKIIIKK